MKNNKNLGNKGVQSSKGQMEATKSDRQESTNPTSIGSETSRRPDNSYEGSERHISDKSNSSSDRSNMERESNSDVDVERGSTGDLSRGNRSDFDR